MSQYQFLIRRGLQGLLVVWGVVTLVFLLRFMTPGSPVDFVAPLDASPELRAQIARNLGLDQPIYVQYAQYLGGLIQGDMGYSYIRGRPASGIIVSRIPATLELAVAATVVAIICSIPLGVLSATRRHQPTDYAATTFSLVGISTPNFWLGIMLIMVVSVGLGILPTSRRPIGLIPAIELLIFQFETVGIRAWIAHMILPAVTLGTYFTAMIVRLTRSGMLDQLGQPYVEAARAKGLPETLVTYKHALRNTMIPIITVLGLQLGSLIGGAVITEFVFNWPGLGTLIIDAIRVRDWPIIQGALIVIGIGFVVINIVVDALYARLNPRVSLE
ncbi:ABC transporter permease subunit [Halorubrum sp. JWXQ-INN 858]|uniref:ABC transporter permease n=1 Tax=Halorubrum sp. JWXQ-INN 858 TaxID=2690782 RepID=UPI00135C7CF4|nr:ABC transporter permease [Halorubrum sp. JWXQ-INN 858]MWV64876.1 ABC transporter permease subunit [Halorubrum sp. JWXQ-INN 858]